MLKINLPSSKKTAVLFLVFNRPDTTIKVFEKIRETKPSRLYVAADGPREGYSDEKEKVMKVRKIATNVDWPCELKTLIRDKNLGCKKGVSSAITWFFEQEEQGIILEDDCVPHLDFFSFCENLLDRYFLDERVSVVTGNNFQNSKWRGDASYYFSKYNHCWGWATWRRAWKHYQEDINFWPEWKTSDAWKKYKSDKIERVYWQKIFDSYYSGQIDTWDYPWTCCNWKLGKLSIAPNVNLVSNIGFGNDATHTKSTNHISSNLKTFDLKKIIHPKKIYRNVQADLFDFDNHFGGKNFRFPLFILSLLKSILKKILIFLKIRKIDKIK
jgi:hypothetical protein